MKMKNAKAFTPVKSEQPARVTPTATDLLTEDLLSMSQAARELPNRPNVSTLWRWANRGLKGNKLQVIRIGGRTLTSRQALTRFLRATNN